SDADGCDTPRPHKPTTSATPTSPTRLAPATNFHPETPDDSMTAGSAGARCAVRDRAAVWSSLEIRSSCWVTKSADDRCSTSSAQLVHTAKCARIRLSADADS